MAPHVARETDQEARNMRAAIRDLHDRLIAGTEDVGERFPQEARKMEDGDIERRPIRGRASFQEAKALLEDGIEILPIPELPSDGN